jgi:hypothetical protein
MVHSILPRRAKGWEAKAMRFDLQPNLKGKLVELRPLRDEDFGRYNREMKELMLRHALKFVEHVVFLIGPENLRSRRAIEKLGAVQAASRVDANGREVVVYEITPDRFRATFGA